MTSWGLLLYHITVTNPSRFSFLYYIIKFLLECGGGFFCPKSIDEDKRYAFNSSAFLRLFRARASRSHLCNFGGKELLCSAALVGHFIFLSLKKILRFILEMYVLCFQMSSHFWWFHCFIAENHSADYTDRLWWAAITGHKTKLNLCWVILVIEWLCFRLKHSWKFLLYLLLQC